jgi:hypothetical protein
MNRYLFHVQINTSNTSNSAHLEFKNGIIIYRLFIGSENIAFSVVEGALLNRRVNCVP